MAKARVEYGGKWTQQSGGAIKTQRAFVADHKQGRNKRCVWTLPTRPYRGAHFAAYPEALCSVPIQAGCPKGGIVLDPFAGSGTTLKVARELGHNYIGIELNADYIKLAEKRLAEVQKGSPGKQDPDRATSVTDPKHRPKPRTPSVTRKNPPRWGGKAHGPGGRTASKASARSTGRNRRSKTANSI